MATTTMVSSSPPHKMKSPSKDTTSTTSPTDAQTVKIDNTTITSTTEADVEEEREEHEPAMPPGYTMIRDPLPNDVLKGRGGGINKHEGNVQFRVFVWARRETYALSSSKQEKVRVAQEVIDLVKKQNPPGRFLKMDPSLTFWVEMTEDDTLAKVTQALREGAPEVRRKEQGISQVSEPAGGSSSSSNPISKLAIGKFREQLRKQKGSSSASKIPRSNPKPPPPSGPKPQSLSGKKHKRAHSDMLSASASAHQQDDTEQHRSFKRSKPLPSGLYAGVAKQPPTWSVVPGSPTQDDDDTMSTDEEEQQPRKRPATKKKTSPKKRAATTGEAHSPTLALMQRLDELEERSGELESQLLDEKKQRLKQEQRQGQLELQLLEVNKARMKQDKVIRKLRREIAELQNKDNGQEAEEEEEAVEDGEAGDDDDNDNDDGELSRASSTELLI